MNTIQIETFVCSKCGEEFEASCLAEFEEKKKKHKCKSINKRAYRTREFYRKQDEVFVNDTVVNDIEEHNFDKLIQQGVVVAG